MSFVLYDASAWWLVPWWIHYPVIFTMLDHPRIELTMVSHKGRELGWQDYSKRLYKKWVFPTLDYL
jgi:hypothetical protein